jgi:hypothetical protein
VNEHEHEYVAGEEPAIRGTVDDRDFIAFPCPFCGARQLKLDYLDLPQDTQRVGVYCGNSHCDAREIEIVTMRGAGAHQRADVAALRAIDRGTDDEQAADGTHVQRDGEGHIEGTVTSYNEASVKRSRGERDVERLDRRLRPTTVDVRPRPAKD